MSMVADKWAERVKDGFEVEVFGDDSIWFKARAPEANPMNQHGLNERLDEVKRRTRNGADSSIHGPNVVTARSTVLDFQRVTGPGLYRHGTVSSRGQYVFPLVCFVINSDLDRAHMPQGWAAGLLPIIPADRFWAWFHTSSPESEDIFRFNPPTEMDAAGMLALETYLFLVINSWTRGLRSQDATRLMQNLGFRVTSREVRTALDNLAEKNWVKRHRRGPPPNGRGFWIEKPTTLTFAVEHGAESPLAYGKDLEKAYMELFEAFVPFLRVPVLDPVKSARRSYGRPAR